MAGKGKKEALMDKEEIAESCCFVCKDGGELLICDYKDCLKCFHPFCVGKDNSVLESEDNWVCDRHTCFRCRRSSVYLYCYTCKNSVCRQCFPGVDFFQIKGKYGFCEFCLSVVLLIEENKDYDSDGDKVDFTDRQTVEFYFVEYYHTMKEKEGFELRDIYVAVERAKTRKKHQSESYLEAEDEEEEYNISDCDGIEDVTRLDEANTSKRMKSATKSSKKENKESVEISSQEMKNCKMASKASAIELLDEEEQHKISDSDCIDSQSRLHRKTRFKQTKSATKSQKEECKLEGEEWSQEKKNGQRASSSNVIELLDSDDEDVNRGKFDDLENDRWCIRGPFGGPKQKYSLSVLRKWSQLNSYSSNFKVWRDDENEENAMWLLEAISIAFPKEIQV